MKTDDVIVTVRHALPCPPACTLSWPVMDANDSSGRGALLVKHGCRTLMRYMPRTVRDTGREREWERTKCGFSVPFRVSLPILVKTRHKARTSTLWYFAFALCCHSNETRAPISNPPNSVQLGGTPTTLPSYIPVRAVVWAFGRGQNHRQTDRQTHRSAWPIYISRRLRLTRNVPTAVLGICRSIREAVWCASQYIGWQWRNFFIPYLCRLFSRHGVGQALRHVCYCGLTFLVR